ncbi:MULTISPECIES: rhodanese-like domain-containing protein [Serratia]|uniref:rhodanese-like domain-containing protein n=1 Tax=Serratia TaxID=613 RepID=UPI00217C1216|nr:rhodanese-like domain-containing protein [Serratia quinivorans]CAI1734490.1 molybdopterin biosynthesis protein MoeB [Serratia quinivorans]CAI1818365.1 molybdopterin biosynthesis protein MoeB [Serratia quinivorans]
MPVTLNYATAQQVKNHPKVNVDSPYPDHQSTPNTPIFERDLTPEASWQLVKLGAAVLVDIRTPEERKTFGYVEPSSQVPWLTGSNKIRNPRFFIELSKVVDKQQPIILLCQTGKRSTDARLAALKAGYTQVYGVLGGVEAARHLPWFTDDNRHP